MNLVIEEYGTVVGKVWKALREDLILVTIFQKKKFMGLNNIYFFHPYLSIQCLLHFSFSSNMSPSWLPLTILEQYCANDPTTEQLWTDTYSFSMNLVEN